MTEVWKDIKGYEGKYQVSNLGRIKSFDFDKFHKGRILKPSYCTSGYLKVHLRKNKKSKQFMIHRIVASEFIDNAENKKTVNHINGIKTDNRVENLEWCSYSENLKHAYKLGLNSWNPKKGKPQKRVLQIDKDTGVVLKEYISIGEASRAIVGKNYSGISDCCNNRQKTAYGYIWRFAE